MLIDALEEESADVLDKIIEEHNIIIHEHVARNIFLKEEGLL